MKSNLKEINKLLIENIKKKTDFQVVEIYYLRNASVVDDTMYTYKQLQKIKENEITRNMLNLLDRGITVVVLKESPESTNAYCAMSLCDEQDVFNRKVGLNICLRRLNNCLTKSNNGSWNYNPKFYFDIDGIKDSYNTIDVITRHLKNNLNTLFNKEYKFITD